MRESLFEVLLPDESVRTTFCSEEATLASLVSRLLKEDGKEIAQALLDSSNEAAIHKSELWAIQKVVSSDPGRIWSEEELHDLGDGLADFDTLLKQLIPKSAETSNRPTAQRQFSDFSLSSHLHKPFLRLVYLPYCLNVTFANIPEMPEDFQYTLFVGASMTKADCIESLLSDFGIKRTVQQGAKTARIEYAFELPGRDQAIPGNEKIMTHLGDSRAMGPPYHIRFTLSREWFARLGTVANGFTKLSRRPTVVSRNSSDATKSSWRPSSMFGLWNSPTPEESAEEEDESAASTLKGSSPQLDTASPRTRTTNTGSRLSSLFDSWAPASPDPALTKSPKPDSNRPSRSRIVSEPISMSNSPDLNTLKISSPQALGITFDTEETSLDDQFEQLMLSLGIKQDSKAGMRSLSDDRKRFLINQHQQQTIAPLRPQQTGPAPSSESTLSNLKRMSLASVGLSWEEAPTTRTHSPASSISSFNAVSTLPPPTTSEWTSWFSSSSAVEESPAWFVSMLKGKNGKNLVKHLISLRVRLATEPLVWMQEFVEAPVDGVKSLEGLLEKTVGKQKVEMGDSVEAMQFECIKCLRVLMNTEIGFERVLSSSHLVTTISYCLFSTSNKLRSQVADILAALCMLSLQDGHRIVLAALSDFKVAHDEKFRFTYLIDSILPKDESDEEELNTGVWEYRAAALSLLNALTNSPEELEERIALREELSSRGLNEVMTALKYCRPPDAVLTQMKVYAEEKQEDQEDLHERTVGRSRDDESTGVPLSELIKLAQEHEDLYPILVQTVKKYIAIFDRQIDGSLKEDLLTILDNFVAHASHLENFDEGWRIFMRQYLTSVQHIVGQQAIIRSSKVSDTASVPSSFIEELEALRGKVEELSDERTALRAELNDRIAETNTLRSLPAEGTSPGQNSIRGARSGEHENFSGVIQRLVQKEKQVLQLQAEVDRLSASGKRAEDPDLLKKERAERNRQWTTLIEEITQLKTKLIDSDAIVAQRQKDIVYLKRALESVYTRFQSSLSAAEDVEIPAAETTTDELVNKSMEALNQREENVRILEAEVASLKAQLVSQQKPDRTRMVNARKISGLVAQHRPAPLPPEESIKEDVASESKAITAPANSEPASSSSVSTSIPPPPPPPPPFMRAASSQIAHTARPAVKSTVSAPSMNQGIPIPPPPPPPAPPSSILSSKSSPRAPIPPPAPSLMSVKPTIKLPPVHITPGVKMKPFFWNKLAAPSVQKSIWADIKPEDHQIDFSQLETYFSAKPAAQSKLIPDTSMPNTAKVQPKTLLDINRATNIGVVLARFRMPATAIRDAILRLDDKRISLDMLKAVKTIAPQSDEIETIRAYTGDFKTLSAGDQLFKEIASIPRLSERLSCMIFRRRFEMDLEEIKPELTILRTANDELRSSEAFKKLLSLILVIGNNLNASTFRGNASGFQLEALLKLKDLRASNAGSNTPTLLHFAVQQIQKLDPKLMDYLVTMRHVEAASRISIASLTAASTAFGNSFAQLKHEVQVAKKAIRIPGDRFTNVMEAFLQSAAPAVEVLQGLVSAIDKDLRELVVYYGEDPSNTKPEDVFATVVTFAGMLHQTSDEMAEDERRKARMAAPRKGAANEAKPSTPARRMDQARSPMRARRREASSDGRNSLGKNGFDQTLRHLRAGSRFGSRRERDRPLSRIFLDGAVGRG